MQPKSDERGRQQQAACIAMYERVTREKILIEDGQMFSLKDLLAALRRKAYPREKMQDPKMQTRFDYTQGPMYYLGQQIVSEMQKAGYPSKIVYGYRSPEKQNELYAQGRTAAGPKVTNAKAFQSAHNYHEAVDICHRTKGWDVSEKYWDTLDACVKIIERRHNVNLVHGHDWDEDGVPAHLDPDERRRDSAHIQTADWRDVKARHGFSEIGQDELWKRFEELLPDKAKYLIQSRRVPSGVHEETLGKGNPKVATFVRRLRRRQQMGLA